MSSYNDCTAIKKLRKSHIYWNPFDALFAFFSACNLSVVIIVATISYMWRRHICLEGVSECNSRSCFGPISPGATYCLFRNTLEPVSSDHPRGMTG